MEIRGIKSGDQLLVRKIDACRPLCEQIKHNGILLIYLKDTGISKIRIFTVIMMTAVWSPTVMNAVRDMIHHVHMVKTV